MRALLITDWRLNWLAANCSDGHHACAVLQQILAYQQRTRLMLGRHGTSSDQRCSHTGNDQRCSRTGNDQRCSRTDSVGGHA